MIRFFPVVFKWRQVEVVDADGVATRLLAMVPDRRYLRVCERQYVEDEDYPLAPLDARSRESHSQFFAALGEGYKNLPETVAGRWESSEHFRKWALVETGWFDELEIEVESDKHVMRLAGRLMAYAKQQGSYVKVITKPALVIVRTPQSQSAAAMGKTEFEQSKRDVLDMLEHFTKVPKGTLMKEAGASA